MPKQGYQDVLKRYYEVSRGIKMYREVSRGIKRYQEVLKGIKCIKGRQEYQGHQKYNISMVLIISSDLLETC